MDKMERLESRILLGAVVLIAITILVIGAVLSSMSPEEHDQLDRDLNAAYGSETSDEDFDALGGCCCCIMPFLLFGFLTVFMTSTSSKRG